MFLLDKPSEYNKGPTEGSYSSFQQRKLVF